MGANYGPTWLFLLLLIIGSSHSSNFEAFEAFSHEDHPMRRDYNNFSMTCFEKFHSSMLKLAILFIDPSMKVEDADMASKCWIKCMFEQFEFINNGGGNGKGEIILSSIMEKANNLTQNAKSRLSRVVAKCHNQIGLIDEICNKAFAFAKCVFESFRPRPSSEYRSIP